MAATRDAATAAKLERLLGKATELYDQLGDVLEEFDEVLGGGAGIGAKLKRVYEEFGHAWGTRYANGDPKAYVWNMRVDAPNAKRIIKAVGVDEVIARIPRFVRDDFDPLLRARHPFAWFVKAINQYAEKSAAGVGDLELDAAPAPADCRHTPRCKSDAEHTSRRRLYMSGSR